MEFIENCLLAKLSKNLDECEYHAEYINRESALYLNFSKVLEESDKVDLNLESSIDFLSAVVILYYELQSTGPWSSDCTKNYSIKLKQYFIDNYSINLDKVFDGKAICSSQKLFDQCLNKLHSKLTSANFKKYPSLQAVYCSLLLQNQHKNITLQAVKTLPISLLLIDDYLPVNKIEGLQCCSAVLQNMPTKEFEEGNYYEVIFGCLKKCIYEKDLKITKLVTKCCFYLVNLLPTEKKIIKVDELYFNMLEQLNSETNLYRKGILFESTKDLISIHQVNCIKWKLFKTVVCESLDACCTDNIEEILLKSILMCLEEWLKYCWCSWQLSSDFKLLSMLLKVLYVCNDDAVCDKIIKIIITIIKLCLKPEQDYIIKNFQLSVPFKKQEFCNRLMLINDYLKYCMFF